MRHANGIKHLHLVASKMTPQTAVHWSRFQRIQCHAATIPVPVTHFAIGSHLTHERQIVAVTTVGWALVAGNGLGTVASCHFTARGGDQMNHGVGLASEASGVKNIRTLFGP